MASAVERLGARNVQSSEWESTLAKCLIAAPDRTRESTRARRALASSDTATASSTLHGRPSALRASTFWRSLLPAAILSFSTSLPPSFSAQRYQLISPSDPAHAERSPGRMSVFPAETSFSSLRATRHPPSLRIFISRRYTRRITIWTCVSRPVYLCLSIITISLSAKRRCVKKRSLVS